MIVVFWHPYSLIEKRIFTRNPGDQDNPVAQNNQQGENLDVNPL